jgi:hypothetical protein
MSLCVHKHYVKQPREGLSTQGYEFRPVLIKAHHNSFAPRAPYGVPKLLIKICACSTVRGQYLLVLIYACLICVLGMKLILEAL